MLPVYGGQAYGPQLRALERGADVVVATPGRALDLVRGKKLKLDGVAVVVLDEADEMLDMGFAEDIEAILAETPKTAADGALLGHAAAAHRRHRQAASDRPGQDQDRGRGRRSREPLPLVRQTAYIVPRGHKLATLGRVLDVENPTSAIVFCRRRNEVDELAENLNVRGYRAEALHGGMTQEQRNRVMKKFRSEASDLLIATDVAARGLDIQHLSHVINFDVPAEAESYVHRIGRVGRAGREGVAITLAEPREHRQIRDIEQTTGQKIAIAKVPTVADLRARRLELTRASVREAIEAGDLDRYRVVVESLADEFDLMDVAMGAVKLLHQANGAEDHEEDEIPEVERSRDRPLARPGRGRPGEARGRQEAAAAARPRDEGRGGLMTRLFVGAGRAAGVRPQDLVGAITGEAGLTGRQVGDIDIADRFSLVEVPEDLAETVIAALRATKIKGRKVTVRRERAT